MPADDRPRDEGGPSSSDESEADDGDASLSEGVDGEHRVIGDGSGELSGTPWKTSERFVEVEDESEGSEASSEQDQDTATAAEGDGDSPDQVGQDSGVSSEGDSPPAEAAASSEGDHSATEPDEEDSTSGGAPSLGFDRPDPEEVEAGSSAGPTPEELHEEDQDDESSEDSDQVGEAGDESEDLEEDTEGASDDEPADEEGQGEEELDPDSVDGNDSAEGDVDEQNEPDTDEGGLSSLTSAFGLLSSDDEGADEQTETERMGANEPVESEADAVSESVADDSEGDVAGDPANGDAPAVDGEEFDADDLEGGGEEAGDDGQENGDTEVEKEDIVKQALGHEGEDDGEDSEGSTEADTDAAGAAEEVTETEADETADDAREDWSIPEMEDEPEDDEGEAVVDETAEGADPEHQAVVDEDEVTDSDGADTVDVDSDSPADDGVADEADLEAGDDAVALGGVEPDDGVEDEDADADTVDEDEDAAEVSSAVALSADDETGEGESDLDVGGDSDSGTDAETDSAPHTSPWKSGDGLEDEDTAEEIGQIGDVDTAAVEDVPLQREHPTGDREVETLQFMRQPVSQLVRRENITVKEHYWLNEPFAYAAILYREREDSYIYQVVEPKLTAFEQEIYNEMWGELREVLRRIDISDDRDREEILNEQVRKAIQDMDIDIAEPALEKVLYYLRRDFIRFGDIDPLMRDPQLEEISVNGDDLPVFVFHRQYENMRTNIEYREGELQPFVEKLAQRSGKDISRSDPAQGADLPDGSRVQLTFGEELTPQGSTITIRKYSEEPFTPVRLVKEGTYSLESMAYLWLLIQNGHNGLVAGGTASGKTTTLNALSMFIPPSEKIVSIEDTRELKLRHENWVPLVTRPGHSNQDASQQYAMYDLVEISLRQRPEHIIVGEVRGDEARALFQAMSTGHYTYSTIHADSVSTVFNRLSNPPLSVERELITELDWVALQATVRNPDGHKVRRSTEVAEVYDLNKSTGKHNNRAIYSWTQEEDLDQIQQRAQSRVLNNLSSQGLDVDQSLNERQRVLAYLLETNTTAYQPVSKVIRGYMTSPDVIMDMIDQRKLDMDTIDELLEDVEV